MVHKKNIGQTTRIEKGLAALGYRVTSNGTLAGNDWQAIRAFYHDAPDWQKKTKEQLLHDLETQITKRTKSLVEKPSRTGYESGKLQENLQWLGLYKGQIDRDEGPLTRRAIASFTNPSIEKKPSLPVTVVLDPGHGYRHGPYYDCGAREGKHDEADIVLEEAKAVQKELLSRGYRVVMTRDEDEHTQSYGSQKEGLHHRLNVTKQLLSNTHKTIFISLHADMAENPSAQGIRIHSAPNDPQSAKLATLLAAEFNDAPSTDKDDYRKDNKACTKQSGFYVLRHHRKSGVPSLLVETGFMSNDVDLKRITSDSGQSNIAEQIADAVQKFLPAPPKKPRSRA